MGEQQGKRNRLRKAATAVGVVAGTIAAVAGVGLFTGGADASLEAAPTSVTYEALSPVSLQAPATTTVVATTAPSTTAAPLATTTTLPGVRLPVPADLPEDAYADTPDQIVGHISIPAIGLSEDVHAGMTLTSINRGPSWWPGTALPGELGNMVIGGHRTTYSRPFHDLDLLKAGDRVELSSSKGTFTYGVSSVDIVEPSAVEIADQTLGYTATLFACHPPGSARYRIVAKLQLLDAAGNPVPGPRGVAVANSADIIRYRS